LKPDISVIIPTFNRKDSLSTAVDSILNQTFHNWELIVVDDGSTDQTRELMMSFLLDSRIKYLYQENAGVSSARNHGAKKANSEWLIFLDSDDELTKNALMHFNDHINSGPDHLLFIAGNSQINSSSRVVKLPKKGEYYPYLSGTFCLNKGVFLKVGGYDPRFLFSENTELFHRIRLDSTKVCYLSEVSLIYNENSNGGSKNLQNMIDSNLLFLEKHENTMADHVKYLYHQIIGVNQMRFCRYSEARKHLWKAYKLKPTKMMTLGRLLISNIPPLAQILYPLAIKG